MKKSTGTLESRWTVVGGSKIHACVSVDSARDDLPVVVLVHGLSVSSRYMLSTARCLAPEYCVHAPDLPGFGKSDKPAHVLDVGELADALVEYMEVVGIQRAPMIANSLGCQIVVDVALRYPERLDRGVLIGPTIDPAGRTVLQQFWRLMRDSLREPLPQQFVVLTDYLRAGPRRTLQTLQYAFEDRVENKLPSVRHPMLVVRGERDPIVPQRWAEEFTRRVPVGELVVIPRTAHTVNYSAPAELVHAIRPFLNGQEGRGQVTRRGIDAAPGSKLPGADP